MNKIFKWNLINCGALLLFIISNVAYAKTVTVQVSVSIDKNPEYLVRQTARIKAQQKGINRLPLVLKGTEKYNSDGYSFDIRALMVGNVDVETVEEKWDRTNNKYHLKANVLLNEKATQELLGQVITNENAQKSLSDAYSLIEKLIDEGIDKNNYIDVKQQISLIKSRTILKGTLAASLQAKKDYERELREFARNAYLAPLLDDGYKIEVLDVNFRQITFRFSVKSKAFEDLRSFEYSNPVIEKATALNHEYVCFSAIKNSKRQVLARFGLENTTSVRPFGSSALKKNGYYYIDLDYDHGGSETVFKQITDSIQFELC